MTGAFAVQLSAKPHAFVPYKPEQLDGAAVVFSSGANVDLVAEIILERGGILYGIRHGSPELRRLLDLGRLLA